MKLRKFVSAIFGADNMKKTHILIAILLVATIPYFLMDAQASSTLTVTDADEYITIENDYFIANITGKLGTSGGAIQHFYIKPYTSINIVCDYGWPSLGGHEMVSLQIGDDGSPAQWGATGIQEVSVDVVYQTSDVVTVRAYTYWNTSEANNINVTLISYKTFYADKPYYVSSDTRIVTEPKTQMTNHEICFLLDPQNYWSFDEDRDSYYFLNRTGQPEIGDGLASPKKAFNYVNLGLSRAFEKFPWFWVYNTTLNNGFGAILIDAKPTSYDIGLGGIAGGVGAAQYTEFEIEYPTAYHPDEPIVVTYVALVQQSTSYSYIDNLASQLYATNANPILDRPIRLFNNGKHVTNSYNRFGRTMGWMGYPDASAITLATQDFQKAGPESRTQTTYRILNDTQMYFNFWTWAGSELEEYIYTDTYTMINYTFPWSNALNFTTTVEIWNSSDTWRVTHLLETTATTNITDAYVNFYSGTTDPSRYWETLDSDHIKINGTELEGLIAEEAYIVKNMTNTEWSAPSHTATYYWINNDVQQQYSAGTTWNITLYIQYFRRYEWQNLDYVDISDFHEPSEGVTEIRDTLNLEFWLPAPLFTQESDLRFLGIADNSSGFHAVVHSSFLNDKLTLISVGESGSTATLQVYCGSKGEPKDVRGATSWSYDSATKICTMTATHSSGVDIEVDWSDGVCVLNVYVKTGNLPVANANVTIEGATKQTNLFGTCIFELPHGHYEVTASYGDKTRTKKLLLKQDKTIRINLPQKKAQPHRDKNHSMHA